MGWESFDVVRFDLGPLLQGQMRMAKPKVLITRLLLVLEVWDGKPTYRKSWAGDLLVWSDLTLDPSFKVKRGWPNLKVLITHLLLVVYTDTLGIYYCYCSYRFGMVNQLIGNHGL